MDETGTHLRVTPLLPREDDKRLRRGKRFQIRKATGFLRCLPDFLVIGEMKCATSSVFGALCSHSQIRPPYRKETHFFTEGFGLGTNWYRAHFPLRGEGSSITGEATPGYLFDLDTPARVASLLPDARFIVVLRDPIERALSHYHHEVRMGRETLDLTDALAVEQVRIEQAEGTPEEKETRLHASYVARGDYAASLKRWYAHFPPSQFHIVETADFKQRPHDELTKIAAFLGIDAFSVEQPAERRNSGNYSAPSGDVIRNLGSRFAASDARLADMLGRQLSWMGQ